MIVRPGSLHPLGYSHPGFSGADFGDAKVSQSRAFFRDKDLLAFPDHGELVRIDPGDE